MSWECKQELLDALNHALVSLGEWQRTGHKHRDSLDVVAGTWEQEREECFQISMQIMHVKWLLRHRKPFE